MGKNKKQNLKNEINTEIIRPELSKDNIKIRQQAFNSQRLRKIKKGLRTFHTLEMMAQTIYAYQITKKETKLNRQLIAAMANEMTHYQDFQIKLFEYGWRPSKLRWQYWCVGIVFGLGSRLLGKKKILKTGIWVETKAVHHYTELLKTIEWDDDTRKMIIKNQSDEVGHINSWKKLLEEMN